MTKNRTVIAIFCIVIALFLCFGLAPAMNTFFSGTSQVLALNTDVAAGVMIESSMLTRVDMSNLSGLDCITDESTVVGKYADTYLYKGVLTTEMISETNETPTTKLESLKAGEYAMTITIQDLASGFGTKLACGDVIMIATKDDDGNAVLYDELQAVEVIATENEDGVDIENNTSAESKPAVITVKLIDKAQVARLFECETATSLHAILVTKNSEQGAVALEQQFKWFEENKPEADKKPNTPVVTTA